MDMETSTGGITKQQERARHMDTQEVEAEGKAMAVDDGSADACDQGEPQPSIRVNTTAGDRTSLDNASNSSIHTKKIKLIKGNDRQNERKRRTLTAQHKKDKI